MMMVLVMVVKDGNVAGNDDKNNHYHFENSI